MGAKQWSCNQGRVTPGHCTITLVRDHYCVSDLARTLQYCTQTLCSSLVANAVMRLGCLLQFLANNIMATISQNIHIVPISLSI